MGSRGEAQEASRGCLGLGHWPLRVGECIQRLWTSGWVKAVFIFPSAAPMSLLTQVWLSAQHSSSVGT